MTSSVSSMHHTPLTSTDPPTTSEETSERVQGNPSQSEPVVTQIVTQRANDHRIAEIPPGWALAVSLLVSLVVVSSIESTDWRGGVGARSAMRLDNAQAPCALRREPIPLHVRLACAPAP